MPRVRTALFLVGANLFWAGNYVLGESAVRSMSPYSVVYARWGGAAIVLLALAQAVERPDWRHVLRQWRRMAILGGVGLAGYNFALYHALRETTALNASLVNAINPALIMVASALVLRERVGWTGWAGLALGLVGVMLVLTDGDLGAVLVTTYNRGDLLMLGAISAWTIYTLIARRYRDTPPITATAMQAAIVTLVMTPAAPWLVNIPVEAGAIGSLAYMALFPSVASYVLWNRAIEHVEPGKAGVTLNLITVFTAIATFALGKPISTAQLVGGALVIAGVVLTQARTSAAPRR